MVKKRHYQRMQVLTHPLIHRINVYTNTGLMPGPVDSPSLSAIEATINPASTDYYYFVADVNTGAVLLLRNL